MAVSPERDHIAGPAAVPLTLVEYGDYQCPYCGAAYPEVKIVQKKLGPRLRFVFRNFPITSAHPFAMRAAETAEAASAQGKFWEMHDFLYEHQDTLGDDQPALTFARSIGLDVRRIAKELDLHTYIDRIKEDFMGGVRSGVNGTPTFFVNGARHDGPPVAEYLLAALESSS
ncbi:MAG: thioredoxin domain-containing protein [Thaumarchaeota archaeon]|nr:thioredoxin domain-containing protein [Nitrososphaerota archaeon]